VHGAALSAIVIASAARATWRPEGVSAAAAVGGAVALVAATAAATTCMRRRSRPWVLLGAFAAMWAFGGLARAVSELALHRALHFPSVADASRLGAVPLALAALVSFGRTTGPWRTSRLLADGAIVGLALAAVAWTDVVAPLVDHAGASPLVSVLSLSYAFTAVIVVSFAFSMLARSDRGPEALPQLVAVGLVLVAVADATAAYLIVTQGLRPTVLFDACWVTGFCLIAWGGLRPPAPATDHRVRDLPSLTGVTLVYAPLVGLMVFAARQEWRLGAIRPEVVWIGLAVVATLLVRQLLALAELRDRERGLVFQARHDPLTRLPNRGHLRELVEDALADAESGVAVLFIDLDHFKSVNEGLGHAKGNQVLLEVSQRIHRCLAPTERAARVGGDEFAVLLPCVPSTSDAAAVAHRLGEAIRVPFCVEGSEVQMSASIGLARGEGGHEPAEGLIHSADLAMHVAKRNGRDRYELFEPQMQRTAVDRVALVADLRRAIDGGDEFVVHFQPQVDLVTGRVEGAEALVRWQHPYRGMVQPLEFIPLAEETGLVVPLGRVVLEQACRQVRRWLDEGMVTTDFELSVNLSARQFRDGGLVRDVVRVLEETALPEQMLVLEITESVFAEPQAAAACVARLKSIGVRVAVDDFGTGYSSLSYLRHLPIDILKIDRGFVMGIDRGPQEAVLPRAIIHLADDLGLVTIAEGVEREEQRHELISLGCRSGQGYLFSAPVPAPAFAAFVKGSGAGPTQVTGGSRASALAPPRWPSSR
jgi:diguanylate cyclase (GGDEF)-like protein